jgi:hypothetical protein
VLTPKMTRHRVYIGQLVQLDISSALKGMNIAQPCRHHHILHQAASATMSFIINPLTKRSALILHPTPSTATRTVVHHARPPRRQRQPAPLNPLVVSPTPGTSRPQPTRSSKSSSRSTVTLLSDTNIELHHAPAPSAPSYNVGNVPDILRWVAGAKDVRRSGQASAEWIRPNRRIQWEKDVSINQQVVDEMRKLREENPQRWSRSALMRKYVFFDSSSPLFLPPMPTLQTF